ncbi:MAG: S1 RNA-binding domain-containing protein [Acidimicrobiales bacterium]
MPTKLSHVVVDGSNIATEGRSLPSLAQLDEAVTTFSKEYEVETLVVVVDATFGHRIDESERAAFDEAISHGEIVTPPAGIIGRGDAFVLEIAERSGATVLSNDSFQEFHGTATWLFDSGRLIGGKPVPGIGWVFVDRVPVRGPVSRRAVKDAKDGKTSGTGGARPNRRRERSKGKRDDTPAKDKGKDNAKSKAKGGNAGRSAGDGSGGGRKRRSRGGPTDYINDALPFIEFVGAHPVGSEVDGEVIEFSSHGAYVLAAGARCYLPLRSMGDPPPRSARDVLSLGETKTFVVDGIDTPRRGIDVALPVAEQQRDGKADIRSRVTDTTVQPDTSAEEAPVTPAKKATKKAAKKAPAKKAAKKAPAKKAAKKAPAKKAAKKAPAKKAAKKAPAKKAAKKAPAKKAPAKKAAKKR